MKLANQTIRLNTEVKLAYQTGVRLVAAQLLFSKNCFVCYYIKIEKIEQQFDRCRFRSSMKRNESIMGELSIAQ